MNLRTIAEFARKADTEDLLDRVTVYADDMEPAAVDLFMAELARRDYHPEQIAAHEAERRQSSLTDDTGRIVRCRYCERPAVARGWRWWKLFGRVPVVPVIFPTCERHGT